MDVIRRRSLISTALAFVLAVESVAFVSAAAGTALAPRSAAHSLPADPPAGSVLAETGTADREWEPWAGPAAAATRPDTPDYLHPRPVIAMAKTTARTAQTPSAAKPAVKTARPTKAAHTTKASTTTTTRTKVVRPVAYVGRNHVWIPSLRVNQSVSFFSCSRSTPPSNYVYRWGCAGSNNVYLLGHAYGVFKPLHDAYVSGRLRVGMKVYYADSSGRTHVYAVKWWRLTAPTTDASWAWAAQSVPSMTLQTCVGAQSQYRLMVRLVQVG